MASTGVRLQRRLAVAVAALFLAGVTSAAVHDPQANGPRRGSGSIDATSTTSGPGMPPEGGATGPVGATTAAPGSGSPGPGPGSTSGGGTAGGGPAGGGPAGGGPAGGGSDTTTPASGKPDTVAARPCAAPLPVVDVHPSAEPFTAKEPGLYAIRPTRTGAHLVASSPTGRSFYGVSFSPDGYKFVASDDQQMWIGNATENANATARVAAGVVNPSYPAWSPDGRSIAFHARSGNASTPYKLWVMAANGSNVRQVPGSPDNAGSATWSPDSQWIAFTTPGFALWVVRPDGTGLRRLATGTTPYAVSWGRNTELAVSGDIGGVHGLHVVRFDGSRRTLSSFNGQVAWSYDCKSILATDERVAVYDAAAGTSGEHVKAGDNITYSTPAWAPDDESMLVTSSARIQDGDTWRNDQDVVIVRRGSKQVLVDMDGSGWVARAHGWSANGTWVLFSIGTY